MKQNPCIGCKDHCCIGDYGTIITLGDIRRISGFTGMKPEEFAAYSDICSDPEGQKELMKDRDHSYFEYSDDGRILQLKSKPNGECIFLKDMCCSVYPQRPLICRIFPVGFRKSAGDVKMLIEEEDKYCPIAGRNSLVCILDFLNFTEEEASALIRQFLDEVEECKSKLDELKRYKLNLIVR